MFETPAHPTIRGPIEYEGRTYWFCSEACQHIFMTEPQKYKDDKTILDLVLEGVLPNDPDEFLRYMGIADPSLGGDLYAPTNGRNGSH
jgi:toluene monooxygenase system protein A